MSDTNHSKHPNGDTNREQEPDFESLDTTERLLEKRRKIEKRGLDYAAEVLGELGEDRHEREEWVGRIPQPRLPMKRIVPEVINHLTSLGVVGAPSMTPREIGRLGAELCVEEGKRESIVFHILERRRYEVNSPLIAPFVVVSKEHILEVAQDVKDKKITLDQIEKDQTSDSYEHLTSLKINNEDLDDALTSTRQRRVIRALHFIFNEPVGSDMLVTRIKKQAAADGTIPLKEVIGRTINWVQHQHDRHASIDLTKLRQEEFLIHLLEGGRIERLRTLARVVLLDSVETIYLSGYNDEQ